MILRKIITVFIVGIPFLVYFNIFVYLIALCYLFIIALPVSLLSDFILRKTQQKRLLRYILAFLIHTGAAAIITYKEYINFFYASITCAALYFFVDELLKIVWKKKKKGL
jgi:hypothetical protein